MTVKVRSSKYCSECVLVPIAGTQEGYNVQAQPVHLDCIDLIWHKGLGFAQKVN